MIDKKFLNDQEKLITLLGNKVKNNDKFFEFCAVYKKNSEYIKKVNISIQQLQEKRNNLSKEIPLILKNNELQKAELIKEEVRYINHLLDINQNKIKEKEAELLDLMYYIPNVPHENIPRGNDENDNIIVFTKGDIPIFNFEVKDHTEIAGENLDFKAGTDISKPRFCFMKDNIAQLHRALVQFMLEQHNKNGYVEYNVPTIVNSESLFYTGQMPKFVDDIFWIQDQELALIPTAEVPLTNLVANQTFTFKDLPKMFVAHSLCYRSEAGSYGKDLKGLIRQHQFEKVELVKIVHPDESFQHLESLLADATNILDLLELPYRVVELCDGDIGFGAAKTYDIEVWVPSQNKYREISSCSNMTDFQARRMNAKYKDGKQKQFVHTLNGSALAVGRTLLAVLENYQNEDGTFDVPKVLQKYMK